MEKYAKYLEKYSIIHTQEEIKILESDIRREENLIVLEKLKIKLDIAKKVFENQAKEKKTKILKIFSFIVLY